jgi:hypothetical protein
MPLYEMKVGHVFCVFVLLLVRSVVFEAPACLDAKIHLSKPVSFLEAISYLVFA